MRTGEATGVGSQGVLIKDRDNFKKDSQEVGGEKKERLLPKNPWVERRTFHKQEKKNYREVRGES